MRPATSLTAAFIVVFCALGLTGCHQKEVANGPIKGMVDLDNLTPEQKIEKIQSDKSVPDRYKQLYINSVRNQEGLPPEKVH